MFLTAIKTPESVKMKRRALYVAIIFFTLRCEASEVIQNKLVEFIQMNKEYAEVSVREAEGAAFAKEHILILKESGDDKVKYLEYVSKKGDIGLKYRVVRSEIFSELTGYYEALENSKNASEKEALMAEITRWKKKMAEIDEAFEQNGKEHLATEIRKYKKVSLDEFFDGKIVSLPLSFEIPAQYFNAKSLEAGITYSYWMLPNEVAKVLESGDLPKKTGYIYGKISTDEGYDQKTGKFTSEENFRKILAESGLSLVESKRFDMKGYPILAFMVKTEEGNMIYSMYVATKIDTNVAYISYTAPSGDAVLGKAVWKHIVESLK